MDETLNWESSYAIALRLKEAHPEADLMDVSLNMIYAWAIVLEGFEDDPALANDAILSAIYQDWLEEILHDPK
jgi:FeS assembly protein IscX